MKGVLKILVLAIIALGSFAGYVVLFSVTSGLKPAQAFSFSSSVKAAPKAAIAENKSAAKIEEPDKSIDTTSTAVASVNPQDSTSVDAKPDTTQAVSGMLDIQLTQIRMEKAELEKLKSEVTVLLKSKSKVDSIQLYGLAKVYDNVDPDQLATMMGNMNDSLVTTILPKLKSQKAAKVLQAMPADRAARISSKLLGIN